MLAHTRNTELELGQFYYDEDQFYSAMLVDFISANSKLYWLDFYINLHEFKSDVDKLKYIFHPREGNRRWFASIPLSFLPLAHSEQVGIHVRGL